MPGYDYRGRDGRGQAVTGQVQAADQQSAATQLQRQGILVLGLNARPASRDREAMPLWHSRRIRLAEKIIFTRQLLALTRAGVPIIRALNGLAESSPNVEIKRIVADISRTLTSGGDLTSAFRQHPKVFSPIYINMLHIGETTGRMPEAFKALVGHLEMEQETSKRLQSALRYPMLVLMSMVSAISIVTLYVIPNFIPVFENMGSELPLATRVLIASSEFATNYSSMIALSVISLVVAAWQYQQTPDGGVYWDALKLRLPIFGSLFRRMALARFARSLAMMMSAGVPILRCLAIVSDSVGNRHVGRAIRLMQTGVERGDQLTRTAASSGLFTPLVLQMMAVGEETGSIDQLMNDVADFYEEEIDYELKQLADAVEPLMLVLMGILVLILALGVFLPIWELGAAARGAAAG
ncbi:type II secretion system F family protein [Oceanobacter antarcticus]|uniref:Type II secretion system F family protein n=1 Tax=Oceanobacter antarcticus TaxID=3133425 RepID=A0ABW8NEN8_9GAMM